MNDWSNRGDGTLYTCTECGLQKTTNGMSYELNRKKLEGLCCDCNLEIRAKKHPEILDKNRLAEPIDPYAGENLGLNTYIRSKSHWLEEVKKQNVNPVG